jgi:DNA-binding transcriptional MerR regulator
VAYRITQLAEAAGLSVSLVRAYQSKGLLHPPQRDGRVALYDEQHLERLATIRELKTKGYSLKSIAGFLRPRPDDADEIAAHPLPRVDDERLSLHDLAERSRVPMAVLRSLEGSGVIRPRRDKAGTYYTTADVRAVRMLLTLLGVGLPMEEFMRLGRLQLATMEEVAAGAIELWTRYVKEPLRQAGLPPAEQAERAEAAFNLLVQAATSLVAYSFERMLRNAAASATPPARATAFGQ